MLNLDTPFPQVLSRGLLIEECQALPVKITQNLGGRGRRQRLQVSIIGREGSSAVKRVTLADLVTAAPLTDAEREELSELECALAGKAKVDRRKLARHEELRHRFNYQQAREREEQAAERRAQFAARWRGSRA